MLRYWHNEGGAATAGVYFMWEGGAKKSIAIDSCVICIGAVAATRSHSYTPGTQLHCYTSEFGDKQWHCIAYFYADLNGVETGCCLRL